MPGHLQLRVPDAVQHEALLRGSGTVSDAELVTVPGLQRTTKAAFGGLGTLTLRVSYGVALRPGHGCLTPAR